MSASPGWNIPGIPPPLAPGYASNVDAHAPLAVTWGDVILRTAIPPSMESNYVALIEPYQLKGWFDSAPDDTSDVDHWTGDGSIHGMLRRKGRTVEIGGVVAAVDGRRLAEAKRLFGSQRVSRLVVSESDLTTEADVRRVTLKWDDINLSHSRFSLTLFAADPLRYGGSQVLRNGSNVLVNRGDVDAFPVIELVGYHNSLTFTHPGGSFTFPSLAAGAARLIDCRNGDVWDGDVRVFPSALSGPWPVNPSGGSTWMVSGLSPAGSAVVKRFEAWS